MKLIINSQLKTGYVGFICGMTTLQHLNTVYVQNDKLEYLLGFKFSQDHLELFFPAVRGRGGYNNNPNVEKFCAAYKKLLIRNEIRGSENANCVDNNLTTLILCVSATPRKQRPTTADIDNNSDYESDGESSEILSLIKQKTLCYIDSMEKDDFEQNDLSKVKKDAVTYIAGFVEKSLLKRIKCSTCTVNINKMELYVVR